MPADPYDAVQDARSETRSEWNAGDVADDAAEAFRWGFDLSTLTEIDARSLAAWLTSLAVAAQLVNSEASSV